jgi:hypothetical protein
MYGPPGIPQAVHCLFLRLLCSRSSQDPFDVGPVGVPCLFNQVERTAKFYQILFFTRDPHMVSVSKTLQDGLLPEYSRCLRGGEQDSGHGPSTLTAGHVLTQRKHATCSTFRIMRCSQTSKINQCEFSGGIPFSAFVLISVLVQSDSV